MTNHCNLIIYYSSQHGRWDDPVGYVEYDYPSYRIPEEITPHYLDSIVNFPTLFGYEDHQDAHGKIGKITSLNPISKAGYKSRKMRIGYKIENGYPSIPMKTFYEKIQAPEKLETSCWKIFRGDLFKILADELCNKYLSYENISPDEMRKIWGNNYQNNHRIFISHRAICKANVSVHIKKPLESLSNASCFVAHDDIRPGSLWEYEIIKALDTANYFVAIVTDDFCGSPWVNQEIGYVYKRNIPRLFLKVGNHNPPGFMGKEQAKLASWESSSNQIKNFFKIENRSW